MTARAGEGGPGRAQRLRSGRYVTRRYVTVPRLIPTTASSGTRSPSARPRRSRGHKRPEIALVTGGVEADVLGDGLGEIPDSDRNAVLSAYPRVDFKRGIVRAFRDGFAYKPATTFGTMNSDVLERVQSGHHRTNFCDLIAANPLGG